VKTPPYTHQTLSLLTTLFVQNKLIAAGQWNVQSISESKGISAEAIETYRKLAKFNYDCGDYQSARDMLENYLSLHASPPKPEADDDEDDVDDRRSSKKEDKSDDTVGDKSMYYLTKVDPDLLQILWGRLSCEILVENWEAATVALTACKKAIERLAANNKLTPLEALKQRTWLMHWSLFVKWNTGGSKGLESMVELFFTERYLQAITTVAPHLLRYLTAAVLLVKRRVAKQSDSARGSNDTGLDSRRLLKDLIRTMQHCDYTDPIVEFVDCLCVKFDFDGAQEKLAECRHLLETDFFLCKQTALFMEEARVFVFENYCRIHNKVDLSTLGQKLAMDEQAAERWIVDLIRNASLDAKIDTEERCVVMGTDVRSTYERVIDKTRDLNVRSGTLVQNMTNLLNDSRKEKARRARAALEEE
jgi:translation initiation factor 3 subunit E